MRVFGTALFRRAANADVGDVAFVVDEVTADVHRRRLCPLPVAGTMVDTMNRNADRRRRLGEQLDETCDQIHASPRDRNTPAGQSGEQARLTRSSRLRGHAKYMDMDAECQKSVAAGRPPTN